MTISPTGLKGLDDLAALFNVSRSEFCDRIGKGQIQIFIPHFHSVPVAGRPENTAGEAA
ncbi:MAG: hypothetical protein AAGC93_16425 [Cyanobacteria bacterium P01_F01_bin.53]